MFPLVLKLRRLGLLAVSTLALLQAPAYAQLTIEITGAGANRIPVAIAEFGGETSAARVVTTVVRGDLERSGLFKMVDTNGMAMTEASTPVYDDWRSRGADALAAGSIGETPDGRKEARFRLFDVNKQSILGGSAFVTSKPMLRAAGHRIADMIYEKLTGEPGIFSTRVAYVVRASATRYELHISDADGQNEQVALISKEPIISPAWSPDGTRLAYVSFENKKPVVYAHSLASGKRIVVANFKGSNSAPAWSPDGRKLAVVLSKDGGSQIFTVNADGSGVQRLTTASAINTEPNFSPDGQSVYFTSDRGGSPQIYRVGVGGGEPQRVSFDGSYNVTPRLSPDGKSMAFISRREGSFRLSVMDLASRQVQVLTDSHKDESPSFSPNGRMILIATEQGGRGVLSAVSIDGRIKQRLSITAGDVREPAWGPFNK
ncbi:Protein TolB [Candidatus Accumulibacter aalborgensis]|uniref:Tol-Pal system protein TolB n=1 Tax=Candidatus Accumulibacter aalborgensis TaxID=1860102 RepID=A0A1A8XD19_9PROT|nr:Tol-Pal system beta propeller repeat protein TolB [Candidatus Accumulibacter aalborgensis]SBT03109.1 Protein TolB [Candidatus Accumulibacter aalborgensis]